MCFFAHRIAFVEDKISLILRRFFAHDGRDLGQDSGRKRRHFFPQFRTLEFSEQRNTPKKNRITIIIKYVSFRAQNVCERVRALPIDVCLHFAINIRYMRASERIPFHRRCCMQWIRKDFLFFRLFSLKHPYRSHFSIDLTEKRSNQ